MKTCAKCHQEKELTNFYKNKTKKNGQESSCKNCIKKSQKKYRKSIKGKVAHWKAAKKFYGTTKYKIGQNRYKQKGLFPNHIKARSTINNAIRAGKLPRPDTLQCHYCPTQAEQYHHHKGYEPEHWLDVVPICCQCHCNYKRRIA